MAKTPQEKLEIKNFGPIQKVNLDIKPFAVFVGESGSGKSLIMKILYFCRWAHAKINILNFFNPAKDKEIHLDHLEREWRRSEFDKFLHLGTEIKYTLDDGFVLTAEVKDNKITFNCPSKTKTTSEDQTLISKLFFISDDRCVIPILSKGVQISGPIPYHTMQTYDQFHQAFAELNDEGNFKIDTLNFKIQKNKDSDPSSASFSIEKNKSSTPFHLASSGMKSIGVIELIAHYATNKNCFMKATIDTISEKIFKKRNQEQFNPKDSKKELIYEYLNSVLKTKARYLTHLFIEEPELSLFPKHQKELIFFLTSKFNNNVVIDTFISILSQTESKTFLEKRFALSTHSPYILTSLNCLLKAGKISEKNNFNSELENIIEKKYWLSPKDFCAFEVKNGIAKNLVEKETGLILAEAIDGVSDEINEAFDNLLNLEYQK